MEFKVEKHTDDYLETMMHIVVTNISTGHHATTTCNKKRSGRVISKMKKSLLHG